MFRQVVETGLLKSKLHVILVHIVLAGRPLGLQMFLDEVHTAVELGLNLGEL